MFHFWIASSFTHELRLFMKLCRSLICTKIHVGLEKVLGCNLDLVINFVRLSLERDRKYKSKLRKILFHQVCRVEKHLGLKNHFVQNIRLFSEIIYSCRHICICVSVVNTKQDKYCSVLSNMYTVKRHRNKFELQRASNPWI